MDKLKKGIINIKVMAAGLAVIMGMNVMSFPVFAAVKVPTASGANVLSNDKAAIDASNTTEGYIMVKYTGGSTAKIKLIIEKQGGTSYTYDLPSKNYEAFPLSQGSGTYKVTVYENIGDTKYAVAYGTTVTSNMASDTAPFLYPNQYVNYKADSKIVGVSNEVTKGCTTEIEKVQAVYKYMILNYTYDDAKAKTVQSGYLPVIDNILSSKKGICFDYASVMVAMLRIQGIPTKLIVGYAGTVYHAWLNVYIKDVGWVNSAIYFDGKQWKIMDPTFASTSKDAAFKPDEKNYTARFAY